MSLESNISNLKGKLAKLPAGPSEDRARLEKHLKEAEAALKPVQPPK